MWRVLHILFLQIPARFRLAFLHEDLSCKVLLTTSCLLIQPADDPCSSGSVCLYSVPAKPVAAMYQRAPESDLITNPLNPQNRSGFPERFRRLKKPKPG